MGLVVLTCSWIDVQGGALPWLPEVSVRNQYLILDNGEPHCDMAKCFGAVFLIDNCAEMVLL